MIIRINQNKARAEARALFLQLVDLLIRSVSFVRFGSLIGVSRWRSVVLTIFCNDLYGLFGRPLILTPLPLSKCPG